MSRIITIHFTKNTSPKHNATVIFFHGSGASGDSMREWVSLIYKNFNFPHIKVAYPTAPLQSYSPSRTKSNVWFDQVDLCINVPEKLDSLDNIKKDILKLIKEENDFGIPSNRIIVGGFSMGGALALHTAYRWDRNVAGVFVFNSFLNENSVVYQALKNTSSPMPPLLQIHGDSDDLVFLPWGEITFVELQACGVQGEFHVMKRLGHSINKKGMNIIKDWVERLLPDL